MTKISKAEKEAQQWLKDQYYNQDKKEYLSKMREDQSEGGKNPPAVPKSMLERDYDKNSDGGYTIKQRHKEYR